MNNDIIYLNHGSTSFPKPPEVIDAIVELMQTMDSCAKRASSEHKIKTDKGIARARENIAEFFNIPSVDHIIFTLNATFAINQVLLGFIKNEDHVIYTDTEHNSVIRPLHYLQDCRHIELSRIPCDLNGELQLDVLPQLIKSNTKLIIVNHVSNVTGIINPIQDIIKIAQQFNVKVAVDASQSAGILPIDVEQMNCDFLFATGHKSLLGPFGIGMAYIRDTKCVDAVITGGTGTNSAPFFHPIVAPEKFEAGTPNYIGIAGLAAGIEYIKQQKLQTMFAHKQALCSKCLSGLKQFDRIKIYGPEDPDKKIPLISFSVNNMLPSHIGALLSDNYNIIVRTGLHCAPLIHKALKTFPNGTVRVSLGYSNTSEEIDHFLQAIERIITL